MRNRVKELGEPPGEGAGPGLLFRAGFTAVGRGCSSRSDCQTSIQLYTIQLQRGSTIALARSASYVFIPIFFLIDLKIFSKQKQYAVY